MLEVTDAAREHLLDRLAESDLQNGCFRITSTGEQPFSLEPVALEPGDVVIQHGGRSILAMTQDVEDKLNGWVLDVEGPPDEDQQLLMMPAQDFPTG